MPDVSGWSLARYVCIAPTDAEADALFDRMLALVVRRRRWRPAPTTPDELAQARHDFLRDQAIVGDPTSCARQIEDLARRTGIGHLRCVFNGNGALDRETTLAGLELFAREVLPACRKIVPPRVSQADATR